MKNPPSLSFTENSILLSPLSFNQLQHLFNSLSVVVCAIDAEGRFAYLSKACADIWGYQPEELLGTPNLDLVVAADHERTQEYAHRLMAGQEYPFFENHYHRKDGSIVPMSWAGRWDAADGMLYAVVREISERKAHEALKSQCFYEVKDIMERISDGFFALDTQWRITYANKEAERIVGVARESVLGKNFWDCYPKALGTIFEQQYRRSMEQQVSVHFEAYYPEPLHLWMEVYVYPSDNGLSVFFRNVTDRKKLQEQLSREQEQRQRAITAAVIKAQEKERAQVGQELHDNINQVLTTVKLYNELALDGVGDTRELLQKSIQYLQRSIDEIRLISKKLAAPTLGKINLKETLKELADSIMLTNRLDITINCGGMNDACMDNDLHIAVYRIIQEHLTNVLKHSQATTVQIDLRTSSQTLYIDVLDNGIGFDVNEKRTGIGITNMTSRAESVNGKLNIISTPGQGCKLKVYLPLGERFKV